MKIVTLIENLVYKKGLYAEHGLAIYLETKNKKILFDTGQSGLFLENAKTLGISIEEIDAVVLSHDHYDHTGGLYPFLGENSKAKIYAKRDIFIPKYNSQSHLNGTIQNDALLSDRIVYVDSVTEIDTGFFIFPEIYIHHPIDTHFKGFFQKLEGSMIPDEFNDELFVVIKQETHINIITACSHRGITNICTTATRHFNIPVGLILGGFHLKNCSIEQYAHVTNYLRIMQPKSIGLCHCTGIEKYAEMYNEFSSLLFYNDVGNVVAL